MQRTLSGFIKHDVENAMSEGAAISEGLNIGSKKQAASDYEARDKYLK